METRVYVTDFCSGAPWEESDVNRALCAADTAFATRFETRERNRCDNAGNQNVIVPHCTRSDRFLEFPISRDVDKIPINVRARDFWANFIDSIVSLGGCIRREEKNAYRSKQTYAKLMFSKYK